MSAAFPFVFVVTEVVVLEAGTEVVVGSATVVVVVAAGEVVVTTADEVVVVPPPQPATVRTAARARTPANRRGSGPRARNSRRFALA
jgi:hypothetical protein